MENADSIIEDFSRQWKKSPAPGFAISIIKKNKTPEIHCFGEAVLEHAVPVIQNTTFYLCSLAKQFTATCLAFLIDQGKISLSDPLRKFLPELPAKVYKSITISHLVHMTSGIHEWYDIMEFSGSYANEYPWRKTLLSVLARQKYLSFTPGEIFSYCNTNYTLLTIIIEMISNSSLADLAKQLIFDPLKLNSTFYCEDNSRVIPRLACGYYQVSDTYKTADKLPPLIGAGGVYSNLTDLTTWLNTIIKQEWQPQIFKILFQPSLLNNGKTNPYLMGFQTRKYRNCRLIQHGGAVPGFFTHICFIPDHNCGFVWLANHNNFKPDRLSKTLLGYLETEFTPQLNTDPESCPPHSDLAKYSGEYIYLGEDKSLILTAENNSLSIEGDPVCYQQEETNLFVNPQNNSQLIIMEDYYQTIILRHLSENGDKFLLKTSQMPHLNKIDMYCNKYYSPELDITYTLTKSDDNLYIDAAKKFTGTDLCLIAPDIFLSPSKGIKIRFLRNKNNQITSFFLDSFRSQNFIFNRISK
ncbi:MAG: beta-lactamase family protein [Candidatus Cloacimonetes bacterium]|nr:beta-lactamase family protein [Candidatus Cloacimonadota bacterium]